MLITYSEKFVNKQKYLVYFLECSLVAADWFSSGRREDNLAADDAYPSGWRLVF